jgi:putative ABC transport system permease protein
MLLYFIKLAFRKFESNWLIFAGSIVTVSIGALCISLLFSYVHNELTMDEFHKRVNDIYMMTVKASPESGYDPVEASLFFKFNYKDYPELESLVSLKRYSKGEIKVSCGQSVFSPEVLIADSTFFCLFDFKLLRGDRKNILCDPGAAIITEDYARKIFGNKDPVGQEIKVTALDIKEYTIKGVVGRVPSNSSITFDLILPNQFGIYNKMGADFLLVRKNFNREAFVKKIENVGHSHPQFKESKLSLISFNELYFNNGSNNFNHLLFTRFGDKKNIYVLFVIMIIIFVITALNFAGLQVIIINTGLKNIGLSKILGIGSRGLVMQKVVELTLLILVSGILVTILYMAVLPYFDRFVKVMLLPAVWEIITLNAVIIVMLFALALIYPLIVTLTVPVADSLKGKAFSGTFLQGQKSIVAIQYTLTIILIIASLVVFRQVSFMLSKDLGFDSKNVVRVKMFQRLPIGGGMDEWKKMQKEQEKNYQYVLNELASIPAIALFAQGESPLSPYTMPWKLSGSQNEYNSHNVLTVHPAYLKLLGLKISEGRFFDDQKDISRGNKVVINEAAKKFWGIKDIQNSRILNMYWGDSTGYEIIGVVKDFNYEHLAVKPQPLFMVDFEDADDDFLIKFKNNAVQSGLESVAKLFKKINSSEDFSYSFLQDDIAALYQKEKKLSIIYTVFTLLALLITAIGIFVIAVYEAQGRTKEIGIRKINGARVKEIMFLLNRDFAKLVLIAFVIACPIAWYAMHTWLQNFAYKTELRWWLFLAAGVAAMAVALLTVSIQSYKASTRNPVEALRYE